MIKKIWKWILPQYETIETIINIDVTEDQQAYFKLYCKNKSWSYVDWFPAKTGKILFYKTKIKDWFE